MRTITLTMPMPPRELWPNRANRISLKNPRGQRIARNAHKNAFRCECGYTVASQLTGIGTLITGPVSVHVEYVFSSNTARDLDNLGAASKTLWDGITDSRRVWVDDKQIRDLRTTSRYEKGGKERVEIVVTELSDMLIAVTGLAPVANPQAWDDFGKRMVDAPITEVRECSE